MRLTVLLLLVIVGFFVMALIAFAVDGSTPNRGPQIFYVFPLLLVGGVVVFMLAAAAVVTVFHRAKLTDKSQPFGLPEGTVRAFLALGLILLFFMIAFFLYYDLAVNKRTGPAVDIAKQLITTLSTLVVAIAAFYFGNASAQTTRGRQAPGNKARADNDQQPPDVEPGGEAPTVAKDE